jgi:hypothetical protein
MAVPTGRTQKRIAKEIVVDLACSGASLSKETAISQNVSAGGIRVATEHYLRPGDRVFLSSPETGFHRQARVVYCERLDNKRFILGLEFFLPVGEWTKPH